MDCTTERPWSALHSKGNWLSGIYFLDTSCLIHGKEKLFPRLMVT
jgi:hypothetical protein